MRESIPPHLIWLLLATSAFAAHFLVTGSAASIALTVIGVSLASVLFLIRSWNGNSELHEVSCVLFTFGSQICLYRDSELPWRFSGEDPQMAADRICSQMIGTEVEAEFAFFLVIENVRWNCYEYACGVDDVYRLEASDSNFDFVEDGYADTKPHFKSIVNYFVRSETYRRPSRDDRIWQSVGRKSFKTVTARLNAFFAV